MSNHTLQKIFRAHANYLDSTAQALKNKKAIFAIQNCRTEHMGTSVYSCEDHHQRIQQHHSCRHRSCYLCAQKTRLKWVEAQRKRIFNIPHFHVVFTLPHEYLNLWRYNEVLFTQILFKASKDTLFELMGDKKYHGVTPGVLMALHTWGRKLDLHPHTHCLVTAGGLTRGGDWQEISDFLLPSRVIKCVYRGKLQSLLREAFTREELQLPPDWSREQFWRCYRVTYKKSWCVRIEERYGHGKGVMLYLSRYLKGGPIHPKQIVSADEQGVTFNYLDHRDKRVKPLSLSRSEFLRRVLTHVPAIGKHTVRFYGLYATCSKKRHDACVSRLGNLEQAPKTGLSVQDMVLFCPKCGQQARLRYKLWRPFKKGNSINKEARRDRAGGYVQQDDEPDKPHGSFYNSA